jgi:competence protein ComEA
MKSKMKYLLLILVPILLFACFIPLINEKETEEEEAVLEETVTEEVEEEVKTLKVDIKGAVKNPGVYTVTEDNRVKDVIDMAGGLLKNAHTSFINLSKKVTDEMVIIIYTNEEIEALEKEETIQYEVVEVPCECPDTQNDACIEEKKETTNTTTSATTEHKININTATQEELLTIPGIGESKAKNIINYRESFPFETIEDIKEVSGIGDALFEKIQDYITV